MAWRSNGPAQTANPKACKRNDLSTAKPRSISTELHTSSELEEDEEFVSQSEDDNTEEEEEENPDPHLLWTNTAATPAPKGMLFPRVAASGTALAFSS